MSWGCMQGALGGPCPHPGKGEPMPGAAGTPGGLVGHWDRACPLPTPHRRQGGDGPRPEAPASHPPTLSSKPEPGLQVAFPAGVSTREAVPTHCLRPLQGQGRRVWGPHPSTVPKWGVAHILSLFWKPSPPELAVGMRGAGEQEHPSLSTSKICAPGLRLYSLSKRSASALLSSPATSHQ